MHINMAVLDACYKYRDQRKSMCMFHHLEIYKFIKVEMETIGSHFKEDILKVGRGSGGRQPP